MVKNHLKRLAMPNTWHIQRKGITFITKPRAGPHNRMTSISLTVLMRDMLNICRTAKEAKYLLSEKKVLVDGKRVRDGHFPVGLFDVLSFPDIKKAYRIVYDEKGVLDVIPIKEEESKQKPYKIVGKRMIKGKIQLHLHDGKNILTDNKEFKVGDTLLLSLPDNKVSSHLAFQKAMTMVLIGGKHIGAVGKIQDIMGNKITFALDSGEVIETLKAYAFIVGKEKSAVSLR